MLFLVVFMVAVIAFVVFMERAQRRIPVQYAKRVVGRKVYGGSNTYLPLRVNTAGVIPVIFASSILVIPQTIAQMIKTPWAQADRQPAAASASRSTTCCRSSGIIFFGYFYTSIVFNPVDTADNMRKYGGFIPGIRPGKKTSDYIDRVLTRITFVGSVYLARGRASCRSSSSPACTWRSCRSASARALDRVLPLWFTEGMGFNFYFGGTSLLIVVGVAMDTIQQIESQLVMRHYDGFMKRGRIRGRRRLANDMLEDHLHRPAGERQGNAGQAARGAARGPAHLHGRHAPRGGRGRTPSSAARPRRSWPPARSCRTT